MVLNLWLLLLVGSASAIPLSEQQPLGYPSTSPAESSSIEPSGGSSRGLSGRFLHITDLHPDSYYKAGSSEGYACHRGNGPAGYFGAEGTECDAPITLINETFRWIEKNLKDNIDFVIWTGDSARHDNDEENPRTKSEILNLNKFIATKFHETFRHTDVPQALSMPVVPTIGNNDIMPHNIFESGPNTWTKNYLDVWAKFIPEYQRHSFVEGGWFTVDVIPNKLAVISLNTMYFFDSNSAVDGCNKKDEPGYEHMEWLRVQLKLLRSQNMKAILMGHVPPARAGSKRSWYESCWAKYTLWLHQYRDVVVGSVYGHMNIDHFMIQDSREVEIDSDKAESASDDSGEVDTESRSSYLSSLREDWSELPSPPPGLMASSESIDDRLPDEFSQLDADGESNTLGRRKKRRKFLKKIGGPFAERYSVSLVSPSLVPNYFPTLRVVEYNVSGLEGVPAWVDAHHSASPPAEIEDDPHAERKKKKKKKPKFKVPEPPSATAPPGPAYSNQPFTWLGYTQYYANITRIHEEMNKTQQDFGGRDMDGSNSTNHEDIFSFEVEYDTRDDVYRMKDLTMRSFFKLATRIAEGYTESDVNNGSTLLKKKKHKKNRVWRAFLDRAFVRFLDDNELDDLE